MRLYRSRFSLRVDRHIREKSLGHLDVLPGAPAAGKDTDFKRYRGASDLDDIGKAGDFVTDEDWPLKAHLGHSDSDDPPLRQTGGDCAASKIHLRDKQYAFPQLPDSVKKILELGGLANYLKTQLAGS